MRHITDLTINYKDDCCCVLEVMEPQSPNEWLSSKIPDFVAAIFYNEMRDAYLSLLIIVSPAVFNCHIFHVEPNCRNR